MSKLLRVMTSTDLSTGSVISIRANIWLAPLAIIHPLTVAATGPSLSVNLSGISREAS